MLRVIQQRLMSRRLKQQLQLLAGSGNGGLNSPSPFTPDDDDTYFRIILPNIYEAEEENRYQVLEACNAITRQYKVLKAYLTPKGNLWLSIEMFVDTTPDIGDFFERCCNILVHGYEDMKKEIFGE